MIYDYSEESKAGQKTKPGKAKHAVFQIRTTDEEKESWADKARELGYKSTADMFRKLVAVA